MELHDDGRMTVTVAEWDRQLQWTGELSRHVAVAFTSVLVIIGNWLHWPWVPYVILAAALGSLVLDWRKARKEVPDPYPR
jgi:hypothetical protein